MQRVELLASTILQTKLEKQLSNNVNMIVHVLDEALAVRTVTVAGEHIINTRKKSPKTAVVLIYQPSVLTRTHLLMTKTYQNPRKTPQLSFPFCPTGMCGYWDAGLLAAVSGPAQGLLD